MASAPNYSPSSGIGTRKDGYVFTASGWKKELFQTPANYTPNPANTIPTYKAPADPTKPDVKGASTSKNDGYKVSDILSGLGSDKNAYNLWKKTAGGNVDVFDYVDYVNNQKKQLTEDTNNLNKDISSGYKEAYQPIFDELDRRIDLLPEQKKRYEDMINELSTGQEADIEKQRQRSYNTLDSTKGVVEANTKRSVQDLEGDIVNQLRGASNYLGVRGAGDSSATEQVSEAVVRAGTKARAGLLGQRDSALKEIELKKTDVDNLASDQLSQVKKYKTDKLFEISNTFDEKLAELSSALANANSESKKSILAEQTAVKKDYLNSLAALDKEIADYGKSIEMWQMQRQAELEDYAAKLSMSSKYTTPSFAKFNESFKSAVALGMPNDVAARIAESESGYILSDDEKAQLQNYTVPSEFKLGSTTNLMGDNVLYQYDASSTDPLSTIRTQLLPSNKTPGGN